MKTKLIFYLGILGVFLFVVTTVIAASLIADYSHMSQLISESYAIDTQYGLQLRLLGYIPSGVLLTLFCFLSVPYFKGSKLVKWAFIAVGFFYGIATVVVSIFPCDSGCNKELINPSVAQLIHNASGALTYTLVPIAILLIGFGLKEKSDAKFAAQSKLLGILSISFVFTLMNNQDSDLVGLYQRVVELSMLLWFILCALAVKNKGAHPSNPPE